MEPTIIYTTVRSSYDDEINESGFDIECRFSDDQKFAAVKVDVEFPNLAHRISDLLNGWNSMKNPPSKDGAFLFVCSNHLPFIGFYNAERNVVKYDGEICNPTHWFDFKLLGEKK